MRIVGGRFRGTQLADLGKGDVKAHLRPTTDRVREAIFNLLAHGGYAAPPPPQGMRVLDLFAGTGALGLEALSRGAAEVTLVDTGKAALSLQAANIKRLGTHDAKSLKLDATALGAAKQSPFDLVFLDPPYGADLAQVALQSARENGWLAQSALIVLEEGHNIAQIPGFRLLDARRYAESWIHVLRVVCQM